MNSRLSIQPHLTAICMQSILIAYGLSSCWETWQWFSVCGMTPLLYLYLQKYLRYNSQQ